MLITGRQNAFAQTPPISPMAGLQKKTVSTNRFYTGYEQYSTNNAYGTIHNVFNKVEGTLISNLDASEYALANTNAQLPVGAHLSVASGDWNGDGHCDNATFVLNKNNKPYLQWTRSSSSSISTVGTYGVEINGLASTVSHSGQSRLNIAAGDVNGDFKDEMVLLYVDSSLKTPQLLVYGYDANTVMQYQYGVTIPVTLLNDYDALHVATGDLDADGDDEIVVGYIKDTNFYIAIYKSNGTTLTLIAQTFIYTTGQAPLLGISSCSVACGRFNGTMKNDITWAVAQQYSNYQNSYVGLVTADMSQPGTSVIAIHGTPINFGGANPNLATGDLNGDFIDEIVYAPNGALNVIKVTNGTNYATAFTGGNLSIAIYYPNSGLAVADIDRDLKAEIIEVGQEFYQQTEYMQWRAFKANAAFTALTIIDSENGTAWDNSAPGGGFPPILGSYPARRYGVAAGSYDGLHYTVGEGVMYMKSDVIQPLIILNAPPVHFDILDGEAYDLAKCYSDGCEFSSTYFTEQSTEIDVSTEVTSDWGVSGTLSAGGSFGVFEVGGYMSAAYGEQYGNTSGTTSTVTISAEVSAIEDDWIYAAVSDYYVWEYPVYRQGAFLGYIANATPIKKEDKWFTSKTWDAFSYIPNHEVGNILSYKDYVDFDNNPDVEEKIRASNSAGSTVTLGGNNSFSWTLAYNDVISNSASTQKDIGVEVGANAGVGGVTLETSATYNKSDLKTYTTTLNSTLSLTTSLSSSLDMSIGEVRYAVTPYTYWAQNGALVLDYAVKPEEAPLGGTPTWWTENYSVQDPAFIMPWRYDPEKGAQIPEIKRLQSKSITFFPLKANTSDTVKIITAIHNFSLVPTQDSVKVQFYVGHPLMGNMITDINGVSDFYVPAIAARDKYMLNIDWQVPTGIFKGPKIYAVIDPDNTIEEIHRNNDIGFNIFSVEDGSLVDTDTIDVTTGITEVPAGMKLMHTYPNPFNTNIHFEYNVVNAGAVELSIYDLEGRLIATPINMDQGAGAYTTKYDATDLSKGIYTYRFASGNHSETGKLVKF